MKQLTNMGWSLSCVTVGSVLTLIGVAGMRVSDLYEQTLATRGLVVFGGLTLVFGALLLFSALIRSGQLREWFLIGAGGGMTSTSFLLAIYLFAA